MANVRLHFEPTFDQLASDLLADAAPLRGRRRTGRRGKAFIEGFKKTLASLKGDLRVALSLLPRVLQPYRPFRVVPGLAKLK
jgi:hypothetical protein